MADIKGIPVTERLPEVSGRYFVTRKDTFGSDFYSYVDIWFYFDGEHDPCYRLDAVSRILRS